MDSGELIFINVPIAKSLKLELDKFLNDKKRKQLEVVETAIREYLKKTR